MYAFFPNDRATVQDWRYTIVSVPLERQLMLINGQEYYFDGKLGTGSFGAVYAARRYVDDKPVAIKVMSLATRNKALSEQNSQAILNEIRMARRLAMKSDHIIHMYDFDFDRQTGLSYIVMERGRLDLEKYLAQRPALMPAERKGIWRQLVDIAVTLEMHLIVHFDIKPQNLVLFDDGKVKLVDLGIAQKAFQNRIGPNGSAPYSAPEVTMANPFQMALNTSKADMWSWGAVLYRMTYMTPPEYDEPCYKPPMGQFAVPDPHLRDVLRNTLVMNPRERASALWLATHPFTNTP